MGSDSLSFDQVIGGAFVLCAVACAPSPRTAVRPAAAPTAPSVFLAEVSAPAVVPEVARVPPELPTPRDGEAYCGSTVTHWDEHRCIRAFGTETQHRRAHSYRLTYRAGKAIRFEAINAHGFPEPGSEGCAVWDYVYTGEKVTRAACRDKLGLERTIVTIDNGGRDYHRFDAWGRPKNLGKTRATTTTRTMSAEGRVTSYAYVARNGKLVPNDDGVCRVETVRNERGALVEERYFDDLGQPILDSSGVHRLRYQRDALAEEVERRAYGLAGEPVVDRNGCHRTVTRRDAFGSIVAVEVFDVAGAPVIDRTTNAFLWVVERNAFGEAVHGSYFDAERRPTLGAWGYHRWHWRFDQQGRAFEWSFFAANGEPMAQKEGHHMKRREFDGRGLAVLDSYWDVAGRPFVFPSGYATFRSSHDARGNLVREEYRDASGELVDYEGAFAVTVTDYDQYDQPVRIQRLDRKGRPAEWNGTAVEVRKYAQDGAHVETSYFDKIGKQLPRVPLTIVRVGFGESGVPRRPDEAQRKVAEARAALALGRPAEVVFAAFSDQEKPAAARKATDPAWLADKLADAARHLRPGKVSPVLDHDGAYWVIRLESEP